MTSRPEHLGRVEHSSSDFPSRTDITKTKRSNALSATIVPKRLFFPGVAAPLKGIYEKLSVCSGAGTIIRIACLRIGGLAYVRAHSMKASISCSQATLPLKQH